MPNKILRLMPCLLLLLAGCGGADPGAKIVGKWEGAGGLAQGMIFEIKNDGTMNTSFDPKVAKDAAKTNLKWHVTKEDKPVLVIEPAEEKGPGLFIFFPGKSQWHFTREGDTLKLIPIGVVDSKLKQGDPLFVLRLLK